jgi:hypothetical protein
LISWGIPDPVQQIDSFQIEVTTYFDDFISATTIKIAKKNQKMRDISKLIIKWSDKLFSLLTSNNFYAITLIFS